MLFQPGMYSTIAPRPISLLTGGLIFSRSATLADEKNKTVGDKSADGKNLQKKKMEYHVLKGRLFEVRRSLKSAIDDKADLEGKVTALGGTWHEADGQSLW